MGQKQQNYVKKQTSKQKVCEQSYINVSACIVTIAGINYVAVYLT